MPISNSLRTFVNIFIAAIGTLLGIYTLSHPDSLYWVYTRASYYIVLIMVFVWAHAACRFTDQENFSFKKWAKENFSALSFIILLCVIIFVSIKPQFRILNDEINLAAISRSMFFEKRVDAATQTDFYALEYFSVLEHKLLNKPLLFPFLTHLLHIIFGYRPENAFVLNFIILAGFLTLIFIFMKKRLGFGWAVASLILLISQPVVVLTATSGIYDLAALLFLLLCYLSLEAYRKNPTETAFRLVWMNFVMLAHIRYESIMFLAITLSLLIIMRLVKLEYFKKSYIYALSILFLLPCFWLKALLPKNILQVPTGKTAFSALKTIEHNLSFFEIFFRFDFSSQYATLVCLTGVIAALFFGIRFLASKNNWSDKAVLKYTILYGSNIAVYWVLITSFHAGRPVSGVIGRYYLFFVTLWTLSAVFLLKKIKLKSAGAIGVAILMLVLYFSASLSGPFLKTTSAKARDYRLTIEMLKEQNDKKALLLTQTPHIFAVNHFPVMGIDYANKRKKEILKKLSMGNYSNIYVVQHIDVKTMRPVKSADLAPEFKLEAVDERRFRRNAFIRLSKVVQKLP